MAVVAHWRHVGVMDVTMFWISFCGTQKEAEQYEYALKIKSDPQNEIQNMVTSFPR